MGSQEVDLLSSWGAPDKTAEAGGKKFHSYKIKGGFGGVLCQGTFIIDAVGIVVNYSVDCSAWDQIRHATQVFFGRRSFSERSSTTSSRLPGKISDKY
jgi:hypothetical protein